MKTKLYVKLTELEVVKAIADFVRAAYPDFASAHASVTVRIVAGKYWAQVELEHK